MTRTRARGPWGALLTAGAVLLVGGCSVQAGTPDSAGEDVAGTWGSSVTFGAQSVTLAADGTAQAYDGCDELSGSWHRTTSGVGFSGWTTTERSCPAIDPWIGDAVLARLEADELVFVNADNSRLGTFQRQG